MTYSKIYDYIYYNAPCCMCGDKGKVVFGPTGEILCEACKDKNDEAIWKGRGNND